MGEGEAGHVRHHDVAAAGALLAQHEHRGHVVDLHVGQEPVVVHFGVEEFEEQYSSIVGRQVGQGQHHQAEKSPNDGGDVFVFGTRRSRNRLRLARNEKAEESAGKVKVRN